MTADANELHELRISVREFLEAKSPEESVRKLMESETRFDPEVWSRAADQLRLPGLALPEEYGGDGFGPVELGVVLEEMGRALFCAPSSPPYCWPPRPCWNRATTKPAHATSPASRPAGPRPPSPSPRTAARGIPSWSPPARCPTATAAGS